MVVKFLFHRWRSLGIGSDSVKIINTAKQGDTLTLVWKQCHMRTYTNFRHIWTLAHTHTHTWLCYRREAEAEFETNTQTQTDPCWCVTWARWKQMQLCSERLKKKKTENLQHSIINTKAQADRLLKEQKRIARTSISFKKSVLSFSAGGLRAREKHWVWVYTPGRTLVTHPGARAWWGGGHLMWKHGNPAQGKRSDPSLWKRVAMEADQRQGSLLPPDSWRRGSESLSRLHSCVSLWRRAML